MSSGRSFPFASSARGSLQADCPGWMALSARSQTSPVGWQLWPWQADHLGRRAAGRASPRPGGRCRCWPGAGERRRGQAAAHPGAHREHPPPARVRQAGRISARRPDVRDGWSGSGSG